MKMLHQCPLTAATLLVAVASVFVAPSAVKGDELQYNFTGGVATPTQGSIANVTGGNATIGNSFGTVSTPISTVSASSGYTIPAADNGGTAGTASGTYNIGQAVNNATTTLSLTTSPYFQFTLQPTSGYAITISDVDFGVRSTSTGAKSFAVYASSDGFASSSFALSTGTITADSTWRFQDNTPPATAFTAAAGSTVTLRIYVFNGASNAGSGTINTKLDDIAILGSTAASGGGTTTTTYQYFDLNSTAAGSGVATGGSYTFSGTHFNSLADGTGTTAAFTNDGTGTATFSAGTNTAVGAYTVNIDTAVKTNGITFNDPNVTLAHAAGGSLTLYGSTVSVATGSVATISEVIAGNTGTIGLTKAGAGTLILSGANTYGGSTTINAGILSVSSATNLPSSTNGIVLGGGTLQTTAGLSLGNAFTGSGSLDIAPGTILASTGVFSTTGVTLVNTGTLDLQGSSPAVGALTFSAAGTLTSSTAGTTIAATGLDATNLTGTATVSAPLSFGNAGTVNVGTGGDLVLGAAISSTGTTALKKAGAGTLELDGSNTGLYRVQIGTPSATTPTVGGTVVINNANSLGSHELYLNVGTLNVTTALTSATSNAVPIGVSIGGLSNGASVITGSNIEFAGASDFDESTIANALTVNNTTILSGVVTTTSKTAQTAASPGVLLNGTGTLRLTGANTFTDPIAISGGVTLEAAGTGGTNQSLGGTTKLTVNAGSTLLLSTANQVNTAAPITLNTGAISIGAGASNVSNGGSQGQGATIGIVSGTPTVSGSSTVGLGALTLSGNSTLYYLGNTGTAVFTSFDPTNSGAGTFTLNVTGSNFGTTTNSSDGSNDRLIFHQDITNVSGANYLGEITFNGVADAVETPLDSGFYEITPGVVPEPSTILGGVLLAGVLGWSQRRRLRGLAGFMGTGRAA